MSPAVKFRDFGRRNAGRAARLPENGFMAVFVIPEKA